MKVVIILTLTLAICIIIFILFKKRREHLISSNVIFLSKEHTRDIYKRNEYIHLLNKRDIKARNIRSKDVVEWYSKRALNFTSEEKEKLAKAIQSIKQSAKNNKNPKWWRFFYSKPWKLAKVSDEVDFGFPHTNEDTIFLPQSFVSAPVDSFFIQTLVHEQVHVWQRSMPSLFEELYTLHWGFIKTNRVCGSVKYLRKQRTNPDIGHLYYIFRGDYLPLSVFEPETNKTKYIGIPVKENSKSDGGFMIDYERNTRDLNTVPEYFNYFKLSNNHYHPDELSAEVIAQLFMETYSSSGSNNNNNTSSHSRATQSLVKWLDLQN
jgi:hypothetical protein